jgi:hypothetical protein
MDWISVLTLADLRINSDLGGMEDGQSTITFDAKGTHHSY